MAPNSLAAVAARLSLLALAHLPLASGGCLGCGAREESALLGEASGVVSARESVPNRCLRDPQEEGGAKAKPLRRLMKAFTARASGPIDDVVEESRVPIPEPKEGELLIRVKACALAPGDIRNLRGDCDLLGPKAPWVIGGDVSGEVVKVGPKPKTITPTRTPFVDGKKEQQQQQQQQQLYRQFQTGDRVCSMFDFRPKGALAQYAVVKVGNTAVLPSSVSCRQAAALPSSVLAAMLLAKQQLRKGDRVLVLGASGGVGTHLVQFLKKFGASYVAVTSTATSLMTSLGADHVIDYRTEEWSDAEEYQGNNRFDMIIDLVGTYESWRKAKQLKVLKGGRLGGRYTTFVGDNRYMQIHHFWDLFSLFRKYLNRALFTRLFWPFYPKYTWYMDGLDPSNGHLDTLVHMAGKGEFKCVLDRSSGPFRFNLRDVKRALRLQESYRAKGKVVVDVS